MKTEHDIRRLFADHGYEVIDIRCNRHWVVLAARGGKRTGTFIFSRSPSSRRAKQYLENDLRRGGHPPRSNTGETQ